MSNRDNGWIASISDLHFRKPRPAAPGNEWSAPDLRHGDHGYHRQPPRTGSAAPRPRSDRDRCASSIEQRPVRLHVDPDRLHEPRPRSAGSRFTWTSTATSARAAPRARHRTAPNQGSQVPPAAAATGRAALRPCSDRARCASSIERRPVREERRRTGVARYHVAATLDVETSETVRNRRPRQSRPRTATRAGSSGATAAPASRLQKRRRARFESGARFASTSTAAPTR